MKFMKSVFMSFTIFMVRLSEVGSS
jgi:hypothetical protein